MKNTDTRVDSYIAKAPPFAQPILEHLREIVHEGCPDVEETLKWNFPHFMYKGMLCSMAAFKQHCAFGFWKGALLEHAPSRGLEAMGQFGRLTTVADLPPRKALIELVAQAAKLNDQGVKTPKVRKPELPRRPAPKAPSAFLAALRKKKKALATYEALSPSHKREYLEWIDEAKSDDTRRRRIDSAIERMSQGKTTRSAAPTSARPVTRGARGRSRRSARSR
jgi:hypothetical protein